MSIQAVAWAIDQRIADHSEKLLLICLANYANARFECFPSWGTLMRDAVMSRATLGRTLQSLRRQDFVHVTQRFNKNGGRATSLYRLNVAGWKNSFQGPLIVEDPDEPHKH